MQITCFVGHVYNLKNSLKFKSLAFRRKWTPFVDQKCTYEKVTKNLGRALPPLIWTKSKRTSVFPRETFPNPLWNKQIYLFSQSIQHCTDEKMKFLFIGSRSDLCLTLSVAKSLLLLRHVIHSILMLMLKFGWDFEKEKLS